MSDMYELELKKLEPGYWRSIRGNNCNEDKEELGRS